jgi:hypothetical protein
MHSFINDSINEIIIIISKALFSSTFICLLSLYIENII